MPAYDEQEYTKSFDIKIWKRLGPIPAPAPPRLCAADSPEPAHRAGGRCAAALPALRRGELHRAGTLSGLWPFALPTLPRFCCSRSRSWASATSRWASRCTGRDLRRRLFTHLQELSFSFYNVTPVGYLIQPRHERHQPHRRHARLEPRGYALGAVLPHLRVRLHAAAQLEAGPRRHPGRAGRWRC